MNGPGRFQFSLLFVIGATLKNVNTSAIGASALYKRLGKSPISACKLQGGKSSGASTKESQGVRAASVILEELYEEMGRIQMRISKLDVGGVLLEF
ncbi:hypothetical protein KSP40_PGU013635 [Platanthera guangdongensis]|uniref:Uncharacterized protein n=1 Tax=Platanthera guangdongensis TaxID=2320717 RepID=A0ABR2MPX8_9ASPA